MRIVITMKVVNDISKRYEYINLIRSVSNVYINTSISFFVILLLRIVNINFDLFPSEFLDILPLFFILGISSVKIYSILRDNRYLEFFEKDKKPIVIKKIAFGSLLVAVLVSLIIIVLSLLFDVKSEFGSAFILFVIGSIIFMVGIQTKFQPVIISGILLLTFANIHYIFGIYADVLLGIVGLIGAMHFRYILREY